MPNELSLELGQLDVLALQFTHDLATPMVGKRGEFFRGIDLVHLTVLNCRGCKMEPRSELRVGDRDLLRLKIDSGVHLAVCQQFTERPLSIGYRRQQKVIAEVDD